MTARILKDPYGIAHLWAETDPEAFELQGHQHARERLWSMEVSRLRGEGRWAEVVGAEAVAGDALARRLGGRANSERDLLAHSPQTREVLEAYACGVNRCIAERAYDAAEFEHLGWEPAEWTPADCLTVARQRGFLMGSVWFKLWRAIVALSRPDLDVSRFRYHAADEELRVVPAGSRAPRATLSAEAAASLAEALRGHFVPQETGGGSNNFVIAGSRTSTGMPIVAGDPHRAFEFPAMYYQMHVRGGTFDAIGFTVPGVPGFPHFAHNGTVAWGLTHTFADIHDLYVHDLGELEERIEQRPEEYRVREETLRVREGEDVRIEVVDTPEGPLVTERGGAGGGALSLKSAQFRDADRSLDITLPMLRARTTTEFIDAMEPWGVLDSNLVCADLSGDIEYGARGRVPVRSAENGLLPVPASDEGHRWHGYVPFADMPREKNPASGFLVTANNRVCDALPDGTYFCTDAHPSYRADRLSQLIAEADEVSPAQAAGFLEDTSSAVAREVVALLADLSGEAVASGSDRGAAGRLAALVAWDGEMAAESTAAADYARIRWTLAARVFAELGIDCGLNPAGAALPVAEAQGVTEVWWMLPVLLRDPEGVIVRERLSALAAEAIAEVLTGTEVCRWDALHTVRFLPLSGPSLFAEVRPEGAAVGGDNETVLANGCVAAGGLRAVYGPVAKYVFDLADLAHGSRWVSLTGTAGSPVRAESMSQHANWAQGDLVPMIYDWEDCRIKAEA
ncbi:penicillin acylase family protein [Brevibacterium album]|uniref:penicillin acylase family protein n=1 Tax=Brevibacterium album TaxID=417948 RepID=UPI000426891B|nr:penicillin acylase family protein [Brevibacterium album]